MIAIQSYDLLTYIGFKFLLSQSTVFPKSRYRASSLLSEKYALPYVNLTDRDILIDFSYAGDIPASFSVNIATCPSVIGLALRTPHGSVYYCGLYGLFAQSGHQFLILKHLHYFLVFSNPGLLGRRCTKLQDIWYRRYFAFQMLNVVPHIQQLLSSPLTCLFPHDWHSYFPFSSTNFCFLILGYCRLIFLS